MKDPSQSSPGGDAASSGRIESGSIGDLAGNAAATASTLYREGRAFLANNEEVSRAADDLGHSVRRNPLAAVGLAFTAGLVLALLVKG